MPSAPDTAASTWPAAVITARLPPASTKRSADSIFGPMLPAGNSPPARPRTASDTVILDSSRSQRVPKSIATRGTPVSSTNRSAPTASASSAVQRSLSITPGTPSTPVPAGATGIPPPPPAITTVPASSSVRTWSVPSTSRGRGLATTRRQPRPASGAMSQRRSSASLPASSWS